MTLQEQHADLTTRLTDIAPSHKRFYEAQLMILEARIETEQLRCEADNFRNELHNTIARIDKRMEFFERALNLLMKMEWMK